MWNDKGIPEENTRALFVYWVPFGHENSVNYWLHGVKAFIFLLDLRHKPSMAEISSNRALLRGL